MYTRAMRPHDTASLGRTKVALNCGRDDLFAAKRRPPLRNSRGAKRYLSVAWCAVGMVTQPRYKSPRHSAHSKHYYIIPGSQDKKETRTRTYTYVFSLMYTCMTPTMKDYLC